MALTVAGIASDSSIDVRQVLLATDPKFIGWVDRIHKDCLHSGVYSYKNLQEDSVITVPGTGSYALQNANIRRVVTVYDRTRDRMLFPIERATAPINQLEKQEPSPGQQGSPQTKFGPGQVSALSFQSGQPEYWRHRPPNPAFGPNDILVLFPTPKQVLTLAVSEEVQVSTLVNFTDTLIIPEDARDMVVAGVNWLTNAFLKRNEEAQAWLQIYQALKTGQSLI